MSMQKFTGTLTTRRISKVPKIWEVHHETGAYQAGRDEPYHTKVSLWVPAPQHGKHLPGIFLRLSNPGGSTYTRMSGDEFADLYVFFRHNHSPAIEAYAEAEARLSIYREAERALIDPTGERFVEDPSKVPPEGDKAPQNWSQDQIDSYNDTL